MVHYWSPSCRCCCCVCSKWVLNKHTFIVMLMISNLWLGRGTACFVAGNVFQLPEMVCSSWSRTFTSANSVFGGHFCQLTYIIGVSNGVLPVSKSHHWCTKKWQQDMTHSRHSHRMQGDVSALRALIEDGHEATMENHGKTEIIGWRYAICTKPQEAKKIQIWCVDFEYWSFSFVNTFDSIRM